ncbi:hypothetical protein M5K25_000668 [Dendrobium thyrsiflorum]|uniref:Uncharacterized protein n=1 Tax=Dendrobium thyrsiflorum TaxID=117978 RepID=A0ABD0VW59_DENTH
MQRNRVGELGMRLREGDGSGLRKKQDKWLANRAEKDEGLGLMTASAVKPIELREGEGKLGRERESCEGEYVKGSQRLLQVNIQVVFPGHHPYSLVALVVSSSASDLGSLPASGGSKRSWVLCLLLEEAKGVMVLYVI